MELPKFNLSLAKKIADNHGISLDHAKALAALKNIEQKVKETVSTLNPFNVKTAESATMLDAAQDPSSESGYQTFGKTLTGDPADYLENSVNTKHFVTPGGTKYVVVRPYTDTSFGGVPTTGYVDDPVNPPYKMRTPMTDHAFIFPTKEGYWGSDTKKDILKDFSTNHQWGRETKVYHFIGPEN